MRLAEQLIDRVIDEASSKSLPPAAVKAFSRRGGVVLHMDHRAKDSMDEYFIGFDSERSANGFANEVQKAPDMLGLNSTSVVYKENGKYICSVEVDLL